MEKTIKMQFKNEDGSVIVKDIPENLYGQYKNIGWEEVKVAKIIAQPKEKKED